MNEFMQQLCDWGLDVIRTVQQIKCTPLTVTAKIMAQMFYVPGYLFLLAFICWCIDIKKGFKLSVVLLFSTSVNNGVKELFKIPRPYTIDSSVGLDFESSWSMPSGHSQASAAFFPAFAGVFPKWKRSIRIIVAVLIPLMVGFSRIYLGVHYPVDVLTGLIFGYIFSIGMLLFWDSVAIKLKAFPTSIKLFIAAIITMLLNAFSPLDSTMAGAFFGVYCGIFLLEKKGGYDAASGTKWQKILRMVIGLIIFAAIYFILKRIFPGSESAQYKLFRFVRYVILGFVLIFAIPFLFIKLKLARNCDVANTRCSEK